MGEHVCDERFHGFAFPVGEVQIDLRVTTKPARSIRLKVFSLGDISGQVLPSYDTIAAFSRIVRKIRHSLGPG